MMARKKEQTKVERPGRRPRPSEFADAVSWLTEHIGYPAPSREELERRRRERQAA
jgi:hypothetical protein